MSIREIPGLNTWLQQQVRQAHPALQLYRRQALKALICFLLLVSICPVSARSLKDVEFRLEDNPAELCGDAVEIVLGCYIANKNLIVIRNGLRGELLKLVITHEIGHYFLQDVSYEEYQKIFGQGDFYGLREKAANKFYEFIWFTSSLEQKYINFFIGVIGKN